VFTIICPNLGFEVSLNHPSRAPCRQTERRVLEPPLWAIVMSSPRYR
jgi:hypothetical protein